MAYGQKSRVAGPDRTTHLLACWVTCINERQTGMARLRRKVRDGDSVAASSIAAECRIMGRPRLAYRWWLKAVAMERSGDDLLEVAYCLQHRVGVARDLEAARHAYERAVLSSNATQYGHEESCYHLATLLIGSLPGSRRKVNQAIA